ncbi:MAG TPA: DNA alkylation repair protein, partial [Miltoncostaeaceae bacterium]|nr:DNA alkylation repair protein [Miltoncostaeaceae bacterium]
RRPSRRSPAPVDGAEGWLGGDAEPLAPAREAAGTPVPEGREEPGQVEAPEASAPEPVGSGVAPAEGDRAPAGDGGPGPDGGPAAAAADDGAWDGWAADLDGLEWAPEAGAPVVGGWIEGEQPAEGAAAPSAEVAAPAPAAPAGGEDGGWIVEDLDRPLAAPAVAPEDTGDAGTHPPPAGPHPAGTPAAPALGDALRDALYALQRVATLIEPPAAQGETPPGAPADPAADALVARVVAAYAGAADPRRAAAMGARAGGRFPYLGIPAHEREALDRPIMAGLPDPSPDTVAAVALRLWELPEREYAYFACDLVRRHVARMPPGFLADLEDLITTRPWTDTVDRLAERALGPLARAHPALAGVLDGWVAEDPWRARAALLHQVHAGRATDADRLFGYCLARGDDADPVVADAIGRALRRYARTAPDEVGAFLACHRRDLPAAAVAEASRDL